MNYASKYAEHGGGCGRMVRMVSRGVGMLKSFWVVGGIEQRANNAHVIWVTSTTGSINGEIKDQVAAVGY